MDNFLEMHNINKTFSGNQVLYNVDFSLKLGEVRALMGENGAGKSTLMNILGGIYQKDKNSGDIIINGEKIEINHIDDAKKRGIAIVHQEISLVGEMTVFDNLFMGSEITKLGGLFLNDREMIKQAQKILNDLKVDIDVRAKVKDLSIAKQQMVEICRALLFDAKILVMDEPTSSLTEKEIAELFTQIARLKQSGMAIVYISHRMNEIFEICDTITVLRDGHLIGTEQIASMDHDKVIQMMVGRDIDKYSRQNHILNEGPEYLKVEHLSNKKLKDISFTLKQGEILGFAGLVGAGRTETARALFGIDCIDGGDIYLEGKKIKIHNVQEAINYGIAYVPEDRKDEGLILIKDTAFNITISVLERFIHGIYTSKKKESDLISEYIQRLSIKMSSPYQLVKNLSGGNQQKVVLSKWLATNPKILILDEPTRGIDIGAKTEIYHLILKMAQSGVSIILISSEMEEIMNLSSRIVVMYEGKITSILNEQETEMVTQEEIMWYASGREKDEKQ